jgi:hypothetical protein
MIALTAFGLVSGSATASDDVVLTLTGAVEGGLVQWTRSDLERLDWQELGTTTSVTDGVRKFRGILMRDILDRSGAEGETVVARALNNYEIDIPVGDFNRFDVLAALYMDGVELTPRDKGPIWIVYPRDDYAELADIRYDMRWVWQLVEIEVR